LQSTESGRGAFFVARGCASGGGRWEVPVENRVFNRGFSHSAGLFVVAGFYYAGQGPDDKQIKYI
jgi:hypothetical protein